MAEKKSREFYIPRLSREKGLYGTDFEVKLRNELTQKSIAKECANWIKRKSRFKSNKTHGVMGGFLTLASNENRYSYAPMQGFTLADIGREKGNNIYNIVQKTESPMSDIYLKMFEEVWNDEEKLEDEIKNLQKEKQELDDLIKLNLEPKANRLKESIKNNQKYIELKNELEVIKRLSDSWVTDLRDIEQEEDTETKYKPLEHFDKGFWDKMDSLLLEILEACKYTPLVSARFGKSSFDIEVNGSKKADNHGKGYRAFLNTIVVLAFRKYMSMEAIYKPSLLVVDTPLLGFDEGTNSETPESQQKALFKYFMNYQHEGQTIVIENSNTIPSLDYEAAGVNEIKFTRGQQEGRYGFLHGVSNWKK